MLKTESKDPKVLMMINDGDDGDDDGHGDDGGDDDGDDVN